MRAIWTIALCLIPTLATSLPAEEAEGVDPVAGAWQRSVSTPQGDYHFLKTHVNGKTTLRVTGPDGAVVESKTSEYRVSETDSVRIFTYFNNVITAGPNAGGRAPGESSYVYRIAEDRFFEVHGMLKGDDGPVQVIVWERVPLESQ